MNKLRESIHQYFRETNSLLYSYLISLPLLLLYEVLIFISQPDAGRIVRISVDIWIKSLFSYFGNDVLSITLIFVAILGLAILYKERDRLPSLNLKYFIYMLSEALCYAFLLALLLGSLIALLFQFIQTQPVESLSTLQKIALSLGAGLYEELFFRVILVSGLLFLFKQFTQMKTAFLLSIIIAALLFSAVHYIGELGDTFTAASFLFRFLFGVALNILYLRRGFGVAAWTHAFYDVMVVAYG